MPASEHLSRFATRVVPTDNKVNEIETIGGSSSTIAQDAAGNITKAPVPVDWSSAYTMVYDAWNRLVAVKSGSTVVASFAYDGQNWRTTKTNSSSVVRHYYYTSSWQIVEERVGTSTSPERQYVWGLLGGIDNLVLRDRPGSSERLYAMSDALGSVTALTNASGTMEERYGYYAFGFPRFMNASFGIISSSAYDWNVLYASYRRDSETGYYQVRNRYLHPGLGRWLTRDPIGYDGGINLYAYVGNSSVNWTDPMGLLFGLIPILGTIEHLIEISLSDVDGTKTSDYTVHQDWAQEACKQDIAEQEFSKLAAFGAAGVLRDVVEYVSGTLIAYLGENWIAKIFGGIIDFDAVIESLVLNDAKEKFDYAAEQAKRECKCPR
jgi:RHS repeat-associated protein